MSCSPRVILSEIIMLPTATHYRIMVRHSDERIDIDVHGYQADSRVERRDRPDPGGDLLRALSAGRPPADRARDGPAVRCQPGDGPRRVARARGGRVDPRQSRRAGWSVRR